MTTSQLRRAANVQIQDAVKGPLTPKRRGSVPCIAVWGPSGSPGVSTVAAAIGAVLAESSNPILIDCDATRGTLINALARAGTGVTLGGAIMTMPAAGIALPAGYLRDTSFGLRFMPGVIGPAFPVTIKAEGLGALLDRLALEGSPLILDIGDELPRRQGSELHIEALRRADIVIVVAQDTPQGMLDLQGEAPLLHETLAGLQCSPLLLGVVNHLEDAHFAAWRRLLRDYKLPFTGHVPHDRLAILRAWERRTPIPVADPGSVAAHTLRALGLDVAKLCSTLTARG